MPVMLPGVASMEEMDGTTHLIAAAPDLLEALRVLLSWTPNVETFDRMGFATKGPLQAITGARAAIAKATGGAK
jgi:hypothetical protein